MVQRSILATFFLTATVFFLPQSTPVAIAAEDEQELFFVAQKAFEDGFYDVSVRYIDQFLEKYPQSQRITEAKILLGQCYFFQGQFLKAYDMFASLKGAAKNQDAVLFWLGETFAKNNELAKAREQYQELVKVFGGSLYRPQAMYSLAWMSFDQQDYEKARTYFRQIIEEYPQHHLVEDAMIKVAESFYNQGNYTEAIKQFEQYLAKYSNTSRTGEVNYNIAESYYALEEYEPAIEYYRRMQDQPVDKVILLSARISQGWSFMKLSEYSRAQLVLDDAEIFAQENDLPLEEVLVAQASLYTDTEAFTEAIDAFDQLIHDFPQSTRVADSYLGRANIYYMQEKFDEAIEDYRYISQQFAGIDVYADIVEKARFGLAWTHLKAGDIDGAIAHFEGVLDEANNDAVKLSALTQIGDAYQEVNELEKAVDIYDRILKEFAESPYADYVQYRQGVALLKLKRFDSALLSFGSLKSNFPNSRYRSDVDYYLGVTYFQKGDWLGAKEVLSKFVEKVARENEFAAEAYYVLGLVYFNLHEYTEAMAMFKQLQTFFADDVALMANVDLSIAKVLYETKRQDEAIASFAQIVEKYGSGDAPEEALIWLGDHYGKNGEHAKALAHYKRFIKRFSDSKRITAVYFELGRVYEHLQEWDEAVAAYRHADGENVPVDLQAQAKLAIGNIFSRQYSPDEAKRVYQNIIKRNPDYKRNAYMNLARLFQKKGEYDGAVDYYREALLADKGDSSISQAEIYFALGDVHEVMNDMDQAVENYLKIPYLSQRKLEWVVKAYLRVGRLFENQEKWEQAKTIYFKLVELKIDESKYAQERIAWINENIK